MITVGKITGFVDLIHVVKACSGPNFRLDPEGNVHLYLHQNHMGFPALKTSHSAGFKFGYECLINKVTRRNRGCPCTGEGLL